jgi:CRISPR-associated endonuclease Csn1
VEPPWDGFIDDARTAIESLVVSHRVDHRLNGALHEETHYSPPKRSTGKSGAPIEVRHVRTLLSKLKREEDLDHIVDPVIRQRVKEQFEKLRKQDSKLGTPEKAFKDAASHPVVETATGRRVPIHRVRIRRRESVVPVGSGPRVRYVKPGSNHHMAIVSVRDEAGSEKRWEAHVVTRLEAIESWRRGEPIVQRDWGPGKRFLFSLRSGDSVRLGLEDGNRHVCVVGAVSGSTIEVKLASDARTATEIRRAKRAGGRRTFGADALRKAGCEKVNVSAMGDVAVARD